MDWSNASLLIVNVIANLGSLGLEEVGKRLFTLLLVVYGVGSLAVFALTVFAERWIKRATAELHAARHHPAR